MKVYATWPKLVRRRPPLYPGGKRDSSMNAVALPAPSRKRSPADADYVANRPLSTALFLALR